MSAGLLDGINTVTLNFKNEIGPAEPSQHSASPGFVKHRSLLDPNIRA